MNIPVVVCVIGILFTCLVVGLCLKDKKSLNRKTLFRDLYNNWKTAKSEREQFELRLVEKYLSTTYDETEYITLIMNELGAFELYRINFQEETSDEMLAIDGYSVDELLAKLPP